MADSHKNFAYSTVLTAPSPASSGTSLVVQSGDGAKFPAVPFNATVWAASAQPITANAEIVRVTAISTDTLTVTRTQESTSARTIVTGDQIAATITAKTLTDIEQVNSYLTSVDQVVAANTQAIVDDYLELAASFVYELASGAELVVGDFAAPLPSPDQNSNIFVSVADEIVPWNSEVVFSDFYELSAPFATEVATNGFMQLGTTPDASSSSPFLPGYEVGYDQVTVTVTVSSATEATGTTVIACAPHTFDGTPVLATFFCARAAPGTSDQLLISLFEGTTQIGRLGLLTTATNAPMALMIRFTPTAGLHTYTVTASRSAANGIMLGGAGGIGTELPMFIRFTKV